MKTLGDLADELPQDWTPPPPADAGDFLRAIKLHIAERVAQQHLASIYTQRVH